LTTLIAVVVVAMFRYLQVLLLIVICILAIGANLPEEMAASLGISKLALMFSLGLLIAVTLINRAVKLLPTGIEPTGTATSEPDYAEEKSRYSADSSSAADLLVARLALLNAISRGDMVALKGLVAMNVSVNFTQDGTTPLHVAAEKGYSDIVQLLIDHGANFRIENANGKTPLEVALDQKKFVRTTEILFNVSKPYFSPSGQAEPRRSDANLWRDQH